MGFLSMRIVLQQFMKWLVTWLVLITKDSRLDNSLNTSDAEFIWKTFAHVIQYLHVQKAIFAKVSNIFLYIQYMSARELVPDLFTVRHF